MTKRLILLIFGTLALCISLYWGISGQQWLEPWTATLSALLYVLGIFFFPPDSSEKKPIQKTFGSEEAKQYMELGDNDTSAEQRSYFSKKSSQRIVRKK
jgi:hypothetical protein